MNILKIFNSKNNAEKSTELNSNINTERINNKDGILEFKEVIKRVANEQKEIRKTTRSSHNKTDCIVLAQFQNNERENSKWLFQANTAYYIVKHYLWLDENKDKKAEYLNKVVEEAKQVFKTDRTDKDKWLVEKFLDGVDNFVKAYIPNE